MNRCMIIACLIGFVASAGMCAGQETNAPPAGSRHPMAAGIENLLPPRLLERLALTADQKTKYDALEASFKKDVAQWRSSHNQGSGSTNNAPSDHKGLWEVRKGYIDQFRASLTSDQIAKLDKALENIRNNRGGPNSGAKTTPPAP